MFVQDQVHWHLVVMLMEVFDDFQPIFYRYCVPINNKQL